MSWSSCVSRGARCGRRGQSHRYTALVHHVSSRKAMSLARTRPRHRAESSATSTRSSRVRGERSIEPISTVGVAVAEEVRRDHAAVGLEARDDVAVQAGPGGDPCRRTIGSPSPRPYRLCDRRRARQGESPVASFVATLPTRRRAAERRKSRIAGLSFSALGWIRTKDLRIRGRADENDARRRARRPTRAPCWRSSTRSRSSRATRSRTSLDTCAASATSEGTCCETRRTRSAWPATSAGRCSSASRPTTGSTRTDPAPGSTWRTLGVQP